MPPNRMTVANLSNSSRFGSEPVNNLVLDGKEQLRASITKKQTHSTIMVVANLCLRSEVQSIVMWSVVCRDAWCHKQTVNYESTFPSIKQTVNCEPTFRHVVLFRLLDSLWFVLRDKYVMTNLTSSIKNLPRSVCCKIGQNRKRLLQKWRSTHYLVTRPDKLHLKRHHPEHGVVDQTLATHLTDLL